MQLVSYLTQIYFSKKVEDFTEKIVAALGLMNAIDLDEAGKEDIKKIEWIEENTHKSLMVSVYKLDRNINPTKNAVKNISRHVKLRFLKNNVKDTDNPTENAYVELTDDTAQYYLCKAIREVNSLVIKNIKSYSQEMKMTDMFEGEDNEPAIEFGDLSGQK